MNTTKLIKLKKYIQSCLWFYLMQRWGVYDFFQSNVHKYGTLCKIMFDKWDELLYCADLVLSNVIRPTSSRKHHRKYAGILPNKCERRVQAGAFPHLWVDLSKWITQQRLCNGFIFCNIITNTYYANKENVINIYSLNKHENISFVKS